MIDGSEKRNRQLAFELQKHIQNSQQFSYRTRVRNLKFPP